MKLFLSSTGINEKQKTYFLKLVGKELNEIKFGLIENAADPYKSNQKEFVKVTRGNFKKLGMKLQLIDLRKYINNPKDLLLHLNKFDVIWFGGGNVYYLRWLLKEVKLDKSIKQLVSKGLVVGGGSAGAIVTGPLLNYYDLVDDSDLAPKVIYKGLGLCNLIIIPHWGDEGIKDKLIEIKKFYTKDKYKIITLTDDQAVMIIDNVIKIIPPKS